MKKNKIKQNNIDKEEEYYSLKKDAVDTLTKALKEDKAIEITKEEKEQGVDPYKIDKLSKIPSWIKIFFIKFWVAGAICYFFIWGLGIYISDTLDMIVFTGLATGIINDVLVNTAFLHFETDKKEYHKYIILPIPAKKMWTLIINIPLGIIQVFGVYYLYVIVNKLLIIIRDLPQDAAPLNVEPILFGLFYLVIELFFIGIKNLIVSIVKDAIKSNEKS